MSEIFTQKELDQIRELAIKGYVNDPHYGLTQDILRLQVIAEATFRFLKYKGMIKEEEKIS